VVPAHDFGSMSTGVARLEGVVIALSCAVLVSAVVAVFSRSAPTAPT